MKNKNIKGKKSYKNITSNIENINFYHCHKINSKYLYNKFNKYVNIINDLYFNINLNLKILTKKDYNTSFINFFLNKRNDYNQLINVHDSYPYTKDKIYDTLIFCKNYTYPIHYIINILHSSNYFNHGFYIDNNINDQSNKLKISMISRLVLKIFTYILYNYTLYFMAHRKNKDNIYTFNEDIYKKYIKLSLPYIYYMYKWYNNEDNNYQIIEYKYIEDIYTNIHEKNKISDLQIKNNNSYETLINTYYNDDNIIKDLISINSLNKYSNLNLLYYIKNNIGMYNVIINSFIRKNIEKISLEGFYCYLVLTTLFYFIITKDNKITKEQFMEVYEPLADIETEFNQKILTMFSIDELFDE